MTTSREVIHRSLSLQRPTRIPVMCQLSIGHILLQTAMDPVEFNFTNDGYAQGLLELRKRYDFDGILIHKPGREEGVLGMTRREVVEGGIRLVFADDGAIECPFDDDPHYIPPSGYNQPTLETVAHDELWDVPESMRHWWLNCGLLQLSSIEDVPDYWYACIDRVKQAVQDEFSIHGEVNSPFDAIFHFYDFEEVLMGLITQPGKLHEILNTLTEISKLWAVAQVRRGCDAIKLSSPWAGSAFISRRHYEEFVLPYERRIVQAVQDDEGVIYTHTCGSIGDRLDLIIQSGVDGIECLDPPPLGDVELERAVSDWGADIFIKGNVDSVNMLLREKPERVYADACRRLEIGAQAQGFILSSACSIAPRVPPQNIHAMVRAARDFNKRE